MKTPPTDNRSAHAARAALEAQRAARVQDAVRAEELENSRRLQEAQARQRQEELARVRRPGAAGHPDPQRPVVLSTARAPGWPSGTIGEGFCSCGYRSRTARSRV